MPDDIASLGQGLPASGHEDLLREILDGLEAPRKTLPPKLFYDEEGCRLFGLITALPEYYPTRTELALLRRHADGIAGICPPGSALIEYGASDETKASMLIETGRFSVYVPIDIAPEALASMTSRLAVSRPDLVVKAICADFTRPVRLPVLRDATCLGFFPGSTIGNMVPDQAALFLRSIRETLGEGARLVVGTDLRKDPDMLVRAYDDASGVTARFNRNILAHVNRIAGARFDPARFDHRAVWNDGDGRIEMHLVSPDAQTVEVGGRQVGFAAGETIHTENSYKYTREGFAALAGRSGWRPLRCWSDEGDLFAIHALEAEP